MPEALENTRRWRVGRKVGRTIYMVVDDTATNDVLIGVMDSPEIAIEAVEAHNYCLTRGIHGR